MNYSFFVVPPVVIIIAFLLWRKNISLRRENEWLRSAAVEQMEAFQSYYVHLVTEVAVRAGGHVTPKGQGTVHIEFSTVTLLIVEIRIEGDALNTYLCNFATREEVQYDTVQFQEVLDVVSKHITHRVHTQPQKIQ